MKSTRHSQQGSALIATLCLIFSAGILVACTAALSKYAVFTIRPQIELQRSFYLNEGAGNRVMYLLAADRKVYPSTIPGELDYAEYDEDRFVADGVIHTLDYYGTPIEFTITDTRSGFDLSSSHEQVFQQLKNTFENDAEYSEKADFVSSRISDYVDGDDDIRDDGEETGEYQEKNMQPLPRNAAMKVREELLYINGFRELFPTDADGRLSDIRLISPEDSEIDLSGKPSVFTAGKTILQSYCDLEEDEAEIAWEALKRFRTERLNLSEQLDADLLPKLRQGLSWDESGIYTINLRPVTGSGRVSRKLTFSFNGFDIGGPADERLSFLEWIAH